MISAWQSIIHPATTGQIISRRPVTFYKKTDVEPERACGYVENIGRENTACEVCTLAELRERQVNMFTTVFIGNSRTKIIGGKLVTPRGYVLPDPAV